MENELHTISSSLALSRSLTNVTKAPQPKGEADKITAAVLSRLAIHYYRPDFTEGQAKLLVADMVEDLREFGSEVVADACRIYRQKPDSRFFPNSGQLRDIAKTIAKERKEAAKPMRSLPSESRPLMWWRMPRRAWKPHWRESEIPQGERPSRAE